MKAVAVSLFTVWVVAGCAGSFVAPDSVSVPAEPTWTNSVQGVLERHCVVCHGAHPTRGAPDTLRLDLYESTPVALGAADAAALIAQRVSDGSMPPGDYFNWRSPKPGKRVPPGEGLGLGPNDTEILRRWAAAGAPK